MTKLILTASILSLLTAPAFAAEERFFSKLEQGIKAEANTQLQGAVGSSIKGNVPASVQRAVKPAANELVKGAVDASASSIKQNNTQKAEAQGRTFANAQPKPVDEPAKSAKPAFPSSTLPVPAILANGTDALFPVPAPKVATKVKRLCRAWAGKDCMPEDRDNLTRNYPVLRDRVAAQAGITAIWNEQEAWSKVYDQFTGKLDFDKADERQMRMLGLLVERSNELVEKGLIHPETLVFRECIKRGLPYRTKLVANSKDEVCS